MAYTFTWITFPSNSQPKRVFLSHDTPISWIHSDFQTASILPHQTPTRHSMAITCLFLTSPRSSAGLSCVAVSVAAHHAFAFDAATQLYARLGHFFSMWYHPNHTKHTHNTGRKKRYLSVCPAHVLICRPPSLADSAHLY